MHYNSKSTFTQPKELATTKVAGSFNFDMDSDNSLLIRAYGEENVMSLFATFKVVLCKRPVFSMETKDIAVRDWPGYDGEDAYISSIIKFKAYDVEFELCFKSQAGSANGILNFLINIFRGGFKDIYCPCINKGFSKCYLKKIDDIKIVHTEKEDVVSFKAVFRVTDPTTLLELHYAGD